MNSSPESTAEPLQASPPGFADVEAAAGRLAGHAVATPLLSSPALDRRVGGRVLLKAETLQRTGSFKFRGAYNRISQIPQDARPAGVVAYSSGNHAQGVAAAAALLGGTFMGITALGLIHARDLAAGDPRRLLALMTAAFGLGQMIGPTFAGVVHDRGGDFTAPSLAAAAALVVAAGLVARRPMRGGA